MQMKNSKMTDKQIEAQHRAMWKKLYDEKRPLVLTALEQCAGAPEDADFKAAILTALEAPDTLEGMATRVASLDLLLLASCCYAYSQMACAKLLLYMSGVVLDEDAVENLLNLIMTSQNAELTFPTEVQPAIIGNVKGVKIPVDVKTDMGKN